MNSSRCRMKRSFEVGRVKSQARHDCQTLTQKEDVMKTALTLFVAALFLMTIPLSASASSGDRHNGRSKHYQSQGKDRYDSGHYRQDRGHKWERQTKKHFKRHQRDHRRHHRYAVRPYTPRPYYYAKPAVVFGVPRIVFNLDW